MNSDGLSYESVLSQLAGERPRLAAALERAEKQRSRRTASLLTGARLKGVEELLQYLDELAEAFRASPQLSRLAFLVARTLADFETAVEATLSGYLAVAADAMRDVMEIENLLLDFAVNPDHIDEWLASDDRTRMRKFMPVKVRERLHAAGQAPFTTSAESIDYRGTVRPCTSVLVSIQSRERASPPEVAWREIWRQTPASGRSSSMDAVYTLLCGG